MLIAAQALLLYLAVVFPVIVVARIVAGTDGARATARFLFLEPPVALIRGVLALIGDTFSSPRSDSNFDSTPPAMDPIMPAQPERGAASLATKLAMVKQEQMQIITKLTAGMLPADMLVRACELQLIDDITVQRHQTYSDDGLIIPLTSITFSLHIPHAMTDNE